MTTVAGIAVEMFGVSPQPAVARFAEDGWAYDESIESGCPECSGELHALSKPYTSGGKQYRYAGFVCAQCVRSFTLQDLGYKSRQAMNRAVTRAAGRTEMHGAGPGSTIDFPAIDTVTGLLNLREWTSFDHDEAIAWLESTLVGWGARLPRAAEAVDGDLPGGGSFASRTTSGDAGTVNLLVVEHQRLSWGCLSSEVRIVADAAGRRILHIATAECSEHSPAGTDMLGVAGEIVRASHATAFGVDPLRVGNTNATTVSRLVEMLRSPGRDIPIVLLSGAGRDAQAQGLVARLTGAALVATIDGDASWALSDSLGSSMGCYAGAVRVYPPFRAGEPSGESPIWVSRRVAQHGWDFVSSEIVATVLTTTGLAPRRPRVEAELQREAGSAALSKATDEIRRLKSELQRERSVASSTTGVDAEIDAIFDAQNATIARLETELEASLEASLELEERLAEAEAARQSLQLALSHQHWTKSDAEGSASVAIVDESVAAAIERLADPNGALVCTEGALRGWRDARYPDPPRMLDALRRLEAAAIEWRAANAEIGGRLGDWLQVTSGLRYAGSDHELERRGLDSFNFDGRKWSRIPHVKIDDAKHSNQVGRIHFAIDSGSQRWIVDHVGQKLYGR